MPRQKTKKLKEGQTGKRVNFYLRAKHIEMLKDIDNHSAFIQLAIEQCVGIMAFALLKEREPTKYYDTQKLEDVLEPYNALYPVDPLTKLRQEKQNARAYAGNAGPSPSADSELW